MTLPFGDDFEASLKTGPQNAKFSMTTGEIRNPDYFCCISGTSVGVAKDPVGVLALTTGRRVCTCATVTVDYSHSWSPSSTINTWSVAWGDGNISNGAWPGAGTVSHPGGGPGCNGYLLPGTYTITLTVTDLLGATHSTTVQIDVVDCLTFATIEMFCTTTGPGNPIWYSNDAGGNLADRSGEVLAGADAYDIAINWFTVPIMQHSTTDNTDTVELWTATNFGLYRAKDGARTGQSWKLIDMPEPALGVGYPEVKAVLCSKRNELEIYVLCHNAANNRVWLARTGDSGVTWNYLELIPPVDPSYSVETYGWTHEMDMSADGRYIYIVLISGVGLDVNFVRVNSDLSGYTETVQGLNASEWGGVRCDYNAANIVWFFGNFEGPGESIRYSEDWGATFEDRSVNQYDPLLWRQHTTEVRPVLMSIYDPDYIVAYNNDPAELECAGSIDRGLTWVVSTQPAPFVNHCGERGWWDHYLWFVGAHVPVAGDRLQLSINLGESMWTERSGGLPVGTDVTSIKIMWEHGYL